MGFATPIGYIAKALLRTRRQGRGPADDAFVLVRDGFANATCIGSEYCLFNL